jgi:ParB/RepB/Spo0J family partition protein
MAIKPGDQNRGSAGESSREVGESVKRPFAAKDSGGRSQAPTRNPLKSPIMQGAYDTSRMRTRKMTLPVTKKVVELTIKAIDPEDTWVSEKINPRNQALLSEKDPHIVSLRQSIKNETQREPVLVRQNAGPNGERYEIIYGSRRRFVGTLEKKALGSFELLAEVGEISDPDAIRLARAENAERQDLSSYEMGCDYAKLRDTAYADFDQKEMAAALGISEASLSKLLALSRIPEPIVKLFVSPSVITVKDGPRILQTMEKMAPAERERCVKQLAESGSSFEKVSQFLKAIEARQAAPSMKISRDKPVTYGGGGGSVEAKLSAIRGKKNTYKIDITGLDKNGLAKLDAFLESLCKQGISR